MRTFYVKFFAADGSTPIATSIQVNIPAHLLLSEPSTAFVYGEQVPIATMAYVCERILGEMIRYAVSECVLTYPRDPPSDQPAPPPIAAMKSDRGQFPQAEQFDHYKNICAPCIAGSCSVSQWGYR